MTLEFRLLGPLQVHRESALVDVRGEKPRAVLALLLIRAERLVSVAAFAEEVWGKDPDEISGNLQVVVSGLRKTLGSEAITTHQTGYSLPFRATDLVHFRSLRAAGDQARAARDANAAGSAYSEALAQWHGDRALEDVRERFADTFAEAIEQELVTVHRTYVEAGLATGLDMVGPLISLTRRFPLDAGFCGQLLEALTRAGQGANAAEEYHGFRERYTEELGARVPDTLRVRWLAISRGELPASHYDSSPGDTGLATALDDDLAGSHARLVHADGSVSAVTGRVTLGRVGCDVVVADGKVSKTHAILSPTAEGYVLTDLHSTNGTFLNGLPVVVPTRLTDGDRIRVGGTELVFGVG